MPSLDAILAVALAGFLLSATPGPSMLYVLSHSVGQSCRAGLASALGLALGGVILAVATALGLAAVFAAFGWIVPVLRIVGSLYLVWLGIGMIRDARTDVDRTLAAADVTRRPVLAIVRRGALVEMLNPKTVLFFALFLPPFIDPDGHGDVWMQLLVLGILVPLTAVPSDLVIAWLGGTMAETLNRRRRMRQAMGWISGLILIAIAANLHLGVI